MVSHSRPLECDVEGHPKCVRVKTDVGTLQVKEEPLCCLVLDTACYSLQFEAAHCTAENRIFKHLQVLNGNRF